MTPKEKAKYLFNTLRNIDNKSGKDCVTCDCVVLPIAKFICDEIIKNYAGLHKPEYCKFDAIGERQYTFPSEYTTHMTGLDMVYYWKKVKTHLEEMG